MVPEAIGHWEQALQIKPTFAEAHYNLANAFLRAGRFEEAIEHYNQALRIKPNYAEAHVNLGIALEQVGRVQAAIEHYEQAVLLRPDLVDVQNDAGPAPSGAAAPAGRSMMGGQTIGSSICANGSPEPSDVRVYEVGRLRRAVRTNRGKPAFLSGFQIPDPNCI